MPTGGARTLLLAMAACVGLVLSSSHAARALSGEPTPLGVPAAPVPDGSAPQPAPWPPAPGGVGPTGTDGIEKAPLPPAQPVEPSVHPQDQSQPGSQLPSPQFPGTQLPGPLPPGSPLPATGPYTPAGTTGTNGLAPDIWQGSEVSRLMALIPRLPAPVGVPSLRNLQRRLLETQSGGSAAVDPLLPIRADKLHQMGFSDEALGLARAPNQGQAVVAPIDPQEAVERALLANDSAGACLQVDAYMARNEAPTLFFRRAVIFCQVMRKESDAASLGIDLLRERADDEQATKDFIVLAALANGETKRVPKKVAAPDPLNVALMKTVGMPAPNAIGAPVVVPIGAAGPSMIARDATRPLPERVAAAEQAFSLGLVTDRELGDLYLQMPAGIADPLTAIGIGDTVDLRAQLFQAAYRGGDPVARARVIGAALGKARQRGDYLNVAQLFGPLVATLRPGPELLFFAPEAARLMFVTGNPDKGGYWLNSLAANPGAFTRPGEKEGLELLGRIAGLTGAAADPVAAWSQASGTVNPRVELLYALLSGLNIPIASDSVGGFQAMPVIALGSPSAEIIAAASVGRKGETLVLMLTGIGGDRAIASDPATLSAGLRSMLDFGFAADARRIASEIAVLAGL